MCLLFEISGTLFKRYYSQPAVHSSLDGSADGIFIYNDRQDMPDQEGN